MVLSVQHCHIMLSPSLLLRGRAFRGVATLGSSRHKPTHNFHKILSKICIKLNVYFYRVFNVFSKIGNEIVIQ